MTVQIENIKSKPGLMQSSCEKEKLKNIRPNSMKQVCSESGPHDQIVKEYGNNNYTLQHTPFKIRHLLQLYDDKDLRFDTEYQRTEVWSIKKKRLLIDSILRKYDISMIFLRQFIDHNRVHYECIDGQQRLKCIFEFIKCGFAITPDQTSNLEQNYYYYQLPQDFQSEIKNFQINSIVVHKADDDTTTDIFMRLQEGVRLNDAEKLNAERSKMRRAVIEISKHPFFSAIALKNHRFAHRYYAAQLLTLSEFPQISDVGYQCLSKTYKLFEKGISRTSLDKTSKCLTLLSKILGSDIHAVRSKSDVLIVHLVTSNLLSGYAINGFEQQIAKFILNFVTSVERLSRSANEQRQDPLTRYAYYKKFASLHIQDKYEIMASELLRSIPRMRPKDKCRFFNKIERIAICRRANNKCEICQVNTQLDGGQADHKDRHTDGGLTIIENGRWLCKNCHSSHHSSSNKP
jgi:hypothetical protein